MNPARKIQLNSGTIEFYSNGECLRSSSVTSRVQRRDIMSQIRFDFACRLKNDPDCYFLFKPNTNDRIITDEDLLEERDPVNGNDESD